MIVACACISFCVAGLMMPALVNMSRSLGAISEVGGRHVGSYPIGRLGGFGVLTGMVFSIICICLFDKSIYDLFYGFKKQLAGIMLSVVIVAGVGFWDDVRRLSALYKLIGQILGAVIAYCFGLKISAVDLPMFETIQLTWMSLPVTIIWVVGIVNAVNLIDGLDGLAGGVLLFASIVNFTAAFVTGALIPAIIMIAMAGGVLGFLRYNWHPAKIYLGDGGAYGLGLILAICGLLAPVQKASTGIALMVPVLAVGLPIFDTLSTMLRRLFNRRGLFVADRGHLHHVLLDSGISHRRVVIGLYAICCLLCSIALVMVLNRNGRIGFILLCFSVFGCVFWGFSVRAHLVQVLKRMLVICLDWKSRR